MQHCMPITDVGTILSTTRTTEKTEEFVHTETETCYVTEPGTTAQRGLGCWG